MSPILLSVKGLKTYFNAGDEVVKAVDGVSFDIEKGRTLGIVGESGSGKSVLSLSLMRLVTEPPGRIEGGTVELQGTDILSMPPKEVRRIRGRRIAMIFQDPMSSLNPYMKISRQLTEITRLHLGYSKREAYSHAIRMLKLVGISDAEERMASYPHQFSGGMRQRLVIAMALSCEPDLLIADEPTTALDVTIQAQILQLIRELKAKTGTSVILITHDLGVVAGMADDVMVMYAGKVFEKAATRDLFAKAGNPYTRSLLKSMPSAADGSGRELYQIPGAPPDLANLPSGCPFAERCYRAEDICSREYPPFVELAANHHSLCHFAREVHAGSEPETGRG